jgi:elongation factor Ts
MSTKITTEDIKSLRAETGVSVMQCKKALEEAEGDRETALIILKKKSGAVASKKADRDTEAGHIAVAKEDGKACIVVLACETDFVGKNEEFTKAAQALAEKGLSEGSEAVVNDSEPLINEIIQKLGENIKIASCDVIEGEVVDSYIHNGTNATIVALSGGETDLARDIAMHISAMKPEYTLREDITEEAVEKARDLFAKEVVDLDKPEEMKEQILKGKITSYFKEQVLMEQNFIKNPELSIEKLLESKGATLSSFVMKNI